MSLLFGISPDKNVVDGVAGLDSNALLPIDRLPVGITNSYTISNDVLESNDPEQETILSQGVDFGSFIFTSLNPSTVTIRFSFKMKSSVEEWFASANIMKNSIAQTLDEYDLLEYQEFVHDISVSQGDEIVLHFRAEPGSAAYVKEFRILGVNTVNPNLGWDIEIA